MNFDLSRILLNPETWAFLGSLGLAISGGFKRFKERHPKTAPPDHSSHAPSSTHDILVLGLTKMVSDLQEENDKLRLEVQQFKTASLESPTGNPLLQATIPDRSLS